MKNRYSNSLTWKIAALGIPLIVGQLGAILQSFADTMMVGQYGTDELSAAGFVGNVFNLVIFFLLGISYGTTPVVGAAFGKNDMCGLGRIFKESLVVNVLVSIVVSSLLVGLYANIEVLDQPEQLLPLIRPYFITQLVSLPFLAVFNSLKQFSDAVGKTRTPMWVMLASNILNIVLNYCLIFGRLGCPEMGLLGAGLATLISRIFMPVALSVVMLSPDYRRLMRADGEKGSASVTREGMKHLLLIGIPIAIQLCLEASSFNIAAIFMGWIGALSLAAHQVMASISTLCFQVIYGVGAAASILASQYRGQGNWLMVRRTVKIAYLMGLACALTVVTLLSINFVPLARLFTTSDDVVAILLTMLPCFVIYQFGDCTQIIFANVLRGLESVKRMMLYAFIAYIIVSLPLSYVFAFVVDLDSIAASIGLHTDVSLSSCGVWMGMPFGLSTAGLLFWLEYRRKVR